MENADGIRNLPRRFEQAAWAAAVAAGVAGALCWAAWVADVTPLSDTPHLLPKPNACVSFVLLAVALLLSTRTATRARRLAARALAAIVAVISALTLLETLASIDLGIDGMLLLHPDAAHPAMRVAAVTCVTLLLLSAAVALLGIQTQRNHRPSEWLAAGAFVLTLLTSADYVLDMTPSLTGISVLAIPTLLALEIAVLFSRADGAWMSVLTGESSGGLAARRTLPLAIVIPLAVSFLRWAGQQRSLYDVEWGVAIMTTITIVLLISAIWWSAARLDAAERQRARERQAVELDLRQINRALRTTNACSEALVHSASEEELLLKIVRVILEEGGHRMAWVGFATDDEQKSVRIAARAGENSEQYLGSATITWGDDEHGRGPSGTAIREMRAAVCRDTLADAQFEPWRAAAIRYGFRSSVALPLVEDGRAFGVLTIYSGDAEAFGEEEIRLLSKLADDLAYGIRALRLRAERDRAEAKASEASRYARTLLEAGVDPLVTIDRHGQIMDVNRATERATGHPRERLIGTDFSDYFVDAAKARAGYQRVFAEGSVRDYPLTIRHVSGATTDVLYNATLFKNTAGEVQGVFGAARDVTERNRIERELQQERQRFSDVLDCLPTYVILLAPDYGVPFANKYFRERFGTSGGRRCFEFLFQRDTPCENCEAFRVLLDGKPRHWDWQGPDGRDYEVSDFPFTDAKGAGLILEMGIDVTERTVAQRQLADRSAELERSNKELQDFASIASHDLQEPLRKVIAFGDRLREHSAGGLDPTGADYLNRMQNAAGRMSKLLTALLEYSRVTTKAQPFERVDMNTVLAEVLLDLETRIQDSGAHVEADPMPVVVADKMQMRQLLQNLIANAVKFHTPGTTPQVKVTSSRQPDGGWTLEVADNGVGFEAEYVERIFRPFQRLHGRNEFEGSGMGLAICRKIVARHRGEITARSRPGEGSVFRVTLPAITESQSKEEPEYAAVET